MAFSQLCFRLLSDCGADGLHLLKLGLVLALRRTQLLLSLLYLRLKIGYSVIEFSYRSIRCSLFLQLVFKLYFLCTQLLNRFPQLSLRLGKCLKQLTLFKELGLQDGLVLPDGAQLLSQALALAIPVLFGHLEL